MVEVTTGVMTGVMETGELGQNFSLFLKLSGFCLFLYYRARKTDWGGNMGC